MEMYGDELEWIDTDEEELMELQEQKAKEMYEHAAEAVEGEGGFETYD